jgi:hypothetical protein
MKAIAVGFAALMALALPAAAQDSATDTNTNGTQQYQPGTGGTSKPGVKGDTGSKNGPAAGSASEGAGTGVSGSDKMDPNNPADGTNSNAAGSDESNVPGDAGGKSGPATTAPSK